MNENSPELDIQCIIPSAKTEGKVAGFEVIAGQGAGPPRHIHRSQIEIFHIIEGTVRFEVNGETFERSAGGSVIVPVGVEHTFLGVSESPARFHFELIPAGDSEQCFEEFLRGDFEDPVAFFDQYDMDLTGPPLD